MKQDPNTKAPVWEWSLVGLRALGTLEEIKHIYRLVEKSYVP